MSAYLTCGIDGTVPGESYERQACWCQMEILSLIHLSRGDRNSQRSWAKGVHSVRRYTVSSESDFPWLCRLLCVPVRRFLFSYWVRVIFDVIQVFRWTEKSKHVEHSSYSYLVIRRHINLNHVFIAGKGWLTRSACEDRTVFFFLLLFLLFCCCCCCSISSTLNALYTNKIKRTSTQI